MWLQPFANPSLGTLCVGPRVHVQQADMGLHGFPMDLASQEGRAVPGLLSSSSPALALPVPFSSALVTVSSCLPSLAILPLFVTQAGHPGWGCLPLMPWSCQS